MFLIFLFISAVIATPVFNKVNFFDSEGNRCPIVPSLNVTCPLICVSDINLCPDSLKPNCPSGQLYCVDGSCRDSCPSSLLNPCQCKLPPNPLSQNILAMIPCLPQPNIDIYQYNPSNPRTIQQACASNLSISDIPLWSPKSDNQVVWKICPVVSPKLTLNEPIILSMFSIVGTQLILILFWTTYKKLLESKTPKKSLQKQNITLQNHSSTSSEEPISDTGNNPISEKINTKTSSIQMLRKSNNSGGINIVEYKKNLIGSFIFYLLISVTFSFAIFIILIILDYYEVLFSSGGAMLVHGSYSLLSQLFIVFWNFATIWVIILSLCRFKLANFFRIKTNFGTGDIVEVSQLEQIILFQKSKTSHFVDFVQNVETYLKKTIGWDKKYSNHSILTSSRGRRYFEFHSTRYIYQNDVEIYDSMEFNIGETGQDILRNSTGLSQTEAEYRSEILGPNFIEVNIPTFLSSVAKEFSSFFYLYQFMILWLFYYYSYYQVGIADNVVILISAMIKVFLNLKSEQRLKKLAEFSDDCIVLRDGKYKKENTKNLVIGDIVALESGKITSFDGVLIKGELIVDESSLTGEAMPIRKIPIKNNNLEYNSRSTGKLHSILAGTTILQSQTIPNDLAIKESFHPTLAVVTSIGTSTEKGKMIRNILYPTQIMFIFNKQIRVVMIILFFQGLLWMGLAIWFMKASAVAAWFSGFFSLAQLISPLLPASLVIGQSVAVQRLKKKNIYCIDIPRVMVAGKVEIFCYDKTGTLTKEGLEFNGISECIKPLPLKIENTTTAIENHQENNDALSLSSLVENHSEMSYTSLLGLGCCHSVALLGEKLIGNPVDIEMFKKSEWALGQTNPGFLQTIHASEQLKKRVGNTTINVIRRNEFVHHRASMSVCVEDEVLGKTHVFMKGSFEKIFEISNKNSIPQNYLDFSQKLAREGGYVLALAQKEVVSMSKEEILKWNQDDMESDLNFVCLVVFRNNLKPDTQNALTQIKFSNTRNVMITGDATLTGIFIARECGMIEKGSRVAIGDVGSNGSVEFVDVDTNETVEPLDLIFPEKNNNPNKNQSLELALTGSAFENLINSGSIRTYLPHTRVFGRMTPQNKVSCVNFHMENGVTAMCGDGGNDCGALRAAHVGIALSSAEASIVSPFSSTNKSLLSCVDLLSQSRGALATSFANYKHLILYGQTMAMFKVFTMYFSISISQPLWIIIDAFITVGISIAVSLSWPEKKLSKYRPTARILGPQTLASSIGQVAINWIFMTSTFAWLFKQSWFRCHEFDSSQSDLAKWWLLGDNYEGEIAGLIVLFQFVNVGFIYNFGYMFRKRWYRNYILVALWATFIVLTSYIELADPNWLGCALRINCGDPNVLVELGYKKPNYYIEPYNIPIGHNVLQRKDRFILWGFSLLNMAIGIAWELIVVIGPVGQYVAKKFLSKKSKIIL
ncbi:hypothetical protein BB559_000814 [Furculomyces boomerangus]|uniref:P-type ATPase A domain-containing protein n=2 Tax=Harpellales TaxID=61421 RepID=A0A2T9Z431_9FUNG|nr:hypothetical protein BB559_000814 [Furculomyces boomerangus]PVZ99600.1 hypothetical protein BB558_004366 [Smittium angustum]